MYLRRLLLATLRRHKVRTLLAAAAVALAVSLVVAVTSGYATIEAVARQFFTQFTGTTDATITAQRRNGTFDHAVLDRVRDRADVARAVGRLEAPTRLIDRDGNVIADKQAEAIGIERPTDVEVDSLRVDAGGWFDADTGDVAVIDQVVADLLKVSVGDTIALPGPRGPRSLQVVGRVHKPGFFAQFRPTVYVPLRTLQDHAAPDPSASPSPPPQLSRVLVEFRPAADELAFASLAAGTDLRVRLTSDQRARMDEGLAGARLVSYLGSTVAVVGSGFIVLSALLMGVTERQRVLAMLRAIGAGRGQVAAVVLGEGLVLAGLGVAVGVPLGVLWVNLLVRLPGLDGLFDTVGVVLDPRGLLLAITGGVLAAVVGSAVPAWHASRVDPLEAMTPLARPPRRALPWRVVLVGVALASLDSVLVFAPLDRALAALGVDNVYEATRAVRVWGHYTVGGVGVLVGFFLAAPAVVWACERVAGPVVAAALGVRFPLLRQQLTGGRWRAAGTAAALMVGLAMLVGLQVQGNTLLGGWRLPTRFPDVFIVSPAPIDLAQVDRIRAAAFVRADQVMPVAVASPQFGTSLFGIMMGTQLMPDATMFFGVDPRVAADMLELEFRTPDGQSYPPAEQPRVARAAMARLAQGRHVIVTDEFRKLRGLHVGDRLPLRTATSGTVDYTIAGVVWSPGLDVITSRFDLGTQVEQRTAASVFGSLDDARRDFGVDAVHMVAANVAVGVERPQVVERLQQDLGRSNLTVVDIRQIKYDIEQGLRRLMLLASTVAFAGMGVAALGVANTVAASVRSRRWQFGLLRSVGVTRGQLVRLVLAEAALLGLVGCALGLGAGFLLAVNARGINANILGYSPPMVVPWDYILAGCAAVAAVSVLASVWPATSTARAEPLTLLAAGRAAT